ncbi:MAG TPA: hypothetical protein VGR24_06745 [bacterium]|nr:hypothetical protein [bacterium]
MTPHHSPTSGAGRALDLPALARTALYRDVWGGRVPAGVEDAPPVSVWQWRRHVHTEARRSLTGAPAVWVLYPIPGDDPIWIPLGPADIETGAALVGTTIAAAGVTPGDTVLAVAPGAPVAGNLLPYLLSSADRLRSFDAPTSVQGVSVFPLSLSTVGYKPDLVVFPLSRRPSVIAGTSADVAGLMELARRAGVTPPRFRLALLVTPPAGLHDAELADATANLLYLPGLFAPIGGRPGRPEVWLPAETATAELIRDDEWGRAVRDLSRVPAIRALTETQGESGELVITVHNAALPVVRMRTAIRVRVAEPGPTGAWLEILSRAPGRAADPVAAFTPAPNHSLRSGSGQANRR